MSKYVDIKVSIWKRLYFTNTADTDKIIKSIKTDDVYDEELGFLECEFLYETEEELSIKENNGNPTIEVFDEDVKEIGPVWINSVK